MQPTQAWKVPWSNSQVPTWKVMQGEDEVWQCRPTRIYTWASRHWVVWNLSEHLMFDCVSEYAGMMELAYISVSNTEFWGFDSLFPHHTYTPLTQSVEYHTFNVRVMGSSPIRCTIYAPIDKWLSPLPFTEVSWVRFSLGVPSEIERL